MKKIIKKYIKWLLLFKNKDNYKHKNIQQIYNEIKSKELNKSYFIK